MAQRSRVMRSGWLSLAPALLLPQLASAAITSIRIDRVEPFAAGSTERVAARALLPDDAQRYERAARALDAALFPAP